MKDLTPQLFAKQIHVAYLQLTQLIQSKSNPFLLKARDYLNYYIHSLWEF